MFAKKQYKNAMNQCYPVTANARAIRINRYGLRKNKIETCNFTYFMQNPEKKREKSGSSPTEQNKKIKLKDKFLSFFLSFLSFFYLTNRKDGAILYQSQTKRADARKQKEQK